MHKFILCVSTTQARQTTKQILTLSWQCFRSPNKPMWTPTKQTQAKHLKRQFKPLVQLFVHLSHGQSRRSCPNVDIDRRRDAMGTRPVVYRESKTSKDNINNPPNHSRICRTNIREQVVQMWPSIDGEAPCVTDLLFIGTLKSPKTIGTTCRTACASVAQTIENKWSKCVHRSKERRHGYQSFCLSTN